MPPKQHTEKPPATRAKNKNKDKNKDGAVRNNNHNNASFKSDCENEELDMTISHEQPKGNTSSSATITMDASGATTTVIATNELNNSMNISGSQATPQTRTSAGDPMATPRILPPIPQPTARVNDPNKDNQDDQSNRPSRPPKYDATLCDSPDPTKDSEEHSPTSSPNPRGDAPPAFALRKGPVTLETLYDALIHFTTSQQNKISGIETQIHSMMNKSDVLLKKSDDMEDTIARTIATKFTAINQTVHDNTAKVVTNTTDISDLKHTVEFQASQILDQAKEIKALQDKLALGDPIARRDAREALRLVNDLEAHGRRWAVRLMGIPTPTGSESKHRAKTIAIDYIRTKLDINTISILDIDCAHRAGRITDGCKPMLVKFFARDHADLVMENRNKLKDTPSSVFEDSTWANLQLLRAVKKHDSVHSAWIRHGSVYAKESAEGQRVKVGIHDNLDTIFM
jgi:hypothetical protein